MAGPFYWLRVFVFLALGAAAPTAVPATTAACPLQLSAHIHRGPSSPCLPVPVPEAEVPGGPYEGPEQPRLLAAPPPFTTGRPARNDWNDRYARPTAGARNRAVLRPQQRPHYGSYRLRWQGERLDTRGVKHQAGSVDGPLFGSGRACTRVHVSRLPIGQLTWCSPTWTLSTQ
ncbi:hypothetical protein MRX96_037603 [Rhipicephalus microplus]